MRRPFFAACLTVLLLVAVLRYELTQQTRHVVVAAHPAATPPPTPTDAATPHSPRRTRYAGRNRSLAAGRGTPSRAASPLPHRSARSTRSVRSAPTQGASSARPTPARSSSPAGPTGTYTGAPSSTPFGVVQVQIKVTDGRITDVVPLQMPDNNPRSRDLSSNAGPQLRQEALDAQSANIDDVSGATYTSEGYKKSLQSAIDQAQL